MKEYDVKITETLEKTVTVQAESHDAAEEQVRAAYYNSEYILDSENFTGVAFGTTEEREVQKEQADSMNVLLVKPFMYPQAVQIGCDLEDLQKAVGGDIEATYDLDEINHNPYELAAYLTVKFEDYTRDEVQATLQWLFEQQYELTLTEVVEIRTRTTSSTDPETGETTTEEEDYEYYILNVKLRNKGLNSVISNSGLSEDDMERYRILLQTRGNRPDIFGNDIYATPGGEYTDYDIPGEALTDTRFANMIREAEKYLGYPYVWGGSSPSTSFDCSGFVSYVINHCGNGWSVGRLTANGLMGVCDIIPKSSAKPGDLIFFQGTYDTSGASHVGIYVGNGMMIHCGNPISYASIESNYWQQHFYCFGRIRN